MSRSAVHFIGPRAVFISPFECAVFLELRGYLHRQQIMGQNVPVDGDFVDRLLILTGDASVGAHGDQEKGGAGHFLAVLFEAESD